MLRLMVLAAAMLGLSSLAPGQTTVGGVVDTDTTWTASGSPYRVTETIVVTGGATLTIETGVRVDFDDGQGMLIGPNTGGAANTGTLQVLGDGGSMGSDFVVFVGGTGVRFDANAISGRLDPTTGAFLGGSILRNARIFGVEPEMFAGVRFAINGAGTVPYLDGCRVEGVTTGGAIRVSTSGSGLSSVRWGRIDVEDAEGEGVVILGGTGHVIETLNIADLRPVGEDRAAFRAEQLSLPSADQWSVEIRGGALRDIASAAGIGPRIAALRVEGVVFERCGTIGIDATEGQRIELVDCVFRDNPRHARGSARALVRGCVFERSGQTLPVGFASGSVFEDSRFENNVGPVMATSGTTVRRCSFIGNAAADGGGALRAFSLDLFDSTFTRNSADRGGAILANIVYGDGNTYTANTARYGGAIFFEGRRSLMGREGSPEVFVGNTASEAGGAIYVDGDAIDLLAARFERNSAYVGGAIYISPYGHSLNLSSPGGSSTVVRDNVATMGPAIFIDPPAFPIGLSDLDAPCVDWGTRDPAAIAARIYDGMDEPGRAVVVFEPIGPCGCRADLDGDGTLSIFDFLAFQTAFDAGDLEVADFDGDGALTLFDFLAFQTAFAAGC
jgi:predicted outer membrane repeat protein